MTNVDVGNSVGLAQHAADAELGAVDASLHSDRFRRSMLFTVSADLVAIYALAVSARELGLAVLSGSVASQTGLLAARLGLTGGLLSARFWTAAVGLILHAAAVSCVIVLLDSNVEIWLAMFAFTLAGCGLAMAGVACVAWLLSARGRTPLLAPHGAQRPQFRFSMIHLFIAMTIFAALALACRWASSMHASSGVLCVFLAVHQVVVFSAALMCFGRIIDAFRAGFWTVAIGLFSGYCMGVVLDLLSPGFTFVFELVQATMVCAWFTAWRVGNEEFANEEQCAA